MSTITMDCPQACLAGSATEDRRMPVGDRLEWLRHMHGRYRLWSDRRATLRALEAMPSTMHKDFGWPSAGDR